MILRVHRVEKSMAYWPQNLVSKSYIKANLHKKELNSHEHSGKLSVSNKSWKKEGRNHGTKTDTGKCNPNWN